MRDIWIGAHALTVKDYHCIECGSGFIPLPDEEYFLKKELKMWLYVNVTDCCNAACPFCVNNASSLNNKVVDVFAFKQMLKKIGTQVYGISFTGGEPLLHPKLLDRLIEVVNSIVDDSVEVDIATNGTNLQALAKLKMQDRISSVHISRHAILDEKNRHLMKWKNAPRKEMIKRFVSSLDDPGKVVLNCVLQKEGVKNCDDIAQYLDFAIEIGVSNTSFISMFQANNYCKEKYVSSSSFPFLSDDDCNEWNKNHIDRKFTVWNRHRDYDYCRCLSGSYKNVMGSTRFYFRSPGEAVRADYCRQLVYTPDNILQDGFGTGKTVLWRDKSSRQSV